MCVNSSSCLGEGGIQTNISDIDSVFTLRVLPSLYCLVFVVGLPLNCMVAWIFLRLGADSGLVVYLQNMVVADLLMLITIPLRVADNLGFQNKDLYVITCRYTDVLFYTCLYMGIIFIGFISLERYAKIVHPSYLKIVHPVGNHVLQTRKAAFILSTVTWAVLGSVMGLYAILSIATAKENVTVPPEISCDFLQGPEVDLLYKAVHTVCFIVFLFVLGALAFLYRGISRRVLLMQRRQSATSTSKKLTKSRRNMLVLVSVFSICFVPYHLIRLPYAFNKNSVRSWGQWFTNLKEVGVMLSACNVCLDPLIYFIFCKAFRAQLMFKRVFDTSEVSSRLHSFFGGWKNLSSSQLQH
uniref:Si:ch73-309g22.1 n=1 Tax=Oryzias latipes TaxID=8090 RepID=A0A3P9LJL9_ORYLA